jgi:hypothetical protein
MGSIIWAACGLVGIMLPGVAVIVFPMVPAPIIFCGPAAGVFWRGEQAASNTVMTTHTDKTFMLIGFSSTKERFYRQVDYIGCILSS